MRIELDPAWRLDAPLDALRAWASGRGRGFNPHDLEGTFRLLLDDVDITRGRAVVPLLETWTALLVQARHLAAEDEAGTVALGRAGALSIRRTPGGLRFALGATAAFDDGMTAGEWLRHLRHASRAFLDALESIAPGAGRRRPMLALERALDHAPPRTPVPARPLHPVADVDDDPPLPAHPRREERLASPAVPLTPLEDDAPRLPQNLRRVSFQRAFRFDASGSRLHLDALGNDLLVATRTHAERRAPDGSCTWTLPVHDVRRIERDPELLAGRDSAGMLALISVGGVRVARVPLPGWDGSLRAALHVGQRRLFLSEREAFALDATHRLTWRHALPGRLSGSCSLEDGLLVWTKEGALTRFEVRGGQGWSASYGLEHVSGVRPLPDGTQAVVVGLLPSREGVLLRVDGRTGAELGRQPLALVRPSGPELFGTRIVVAGETAVGPRVLAFPMEGGPVEWASAPPFDGRPSLATDATNLLVGRAGGAVVALTSHGRVRWATPPPDADPALGPAEPPPPLPTAGIVLAAGARIHVLDSVTGRRVATLEPPELSPRHLLVLPGPLVVVSGAEGQPVEGFRFRGLLRVV